MDDQQIINWLLKGDISIQYQVHRDLLGDDKKNLRARITQEGWGKQFLSKRKPNGHWGVSFYQPKWISTHYTLLDLRNLNPDQDHSRVKETIEMVLGEGKAEDGGIPLGPSTMKHSDICVNGMFLNYASYFRTEEKKLHSVVDSILNEVMHDGGYNCMSVRSGARHSSLHSTLSVLEGLYEFQKSGSPYRSKDIQKARRDAEEFILIHQLFLSDHTGEIIKKEFLSMPYPSRWKYNVLRAMDYFQYAKTPWDQRMKAAIELILQKRNKEGTWNMNAAHSGSVHFTMEHAGKPSRWNTLRALRVLKQYSINKTNYTRTY
tara:strand:- start:407 stop:1360 length:954 start_codon:yes stop_codon:yes gene_type:complete